MAAALSTYATGDSVASATVANPERSFGPSCWAINNTQAAGAQCTISQAAKAGVAHTCSAFVASVAVTTALAAGATFIINIRDGATGVGTVLYTFTLGTGQGGATAPIGTVDRFGLSGLNIVGSVNTAMTIEFSAAATSSETCTVSMSGYDQV